MWRKQFLASLVSEERIFQKWQTEQLTLSKFLLKFQKLSIAIKLGRIIEPDFCSTGQQRASFFDNPVLDKLIFVKWSSKRTTDTNQLSWTKKVPGKLLNYPVATKFAGILQQDLRIIDLHYRMGRIQQVSHESGFGENFFLKIAVQTTNVDHVLK